MGNMYECKKKGSGGGGSAPDSSLDWDNSEILTMVNSIATVPYDGILFGSCEGSTKAKFKINDNTICSTINSDLDSTQSRYFPANIPVKAGTQLQGILDVTGLRIVPYKNQNNHPPVPDWTQAVQIHNETYECPSSGIVIGTTSKYNDIIYLNNIVFNTRGMEMGNLRWTYVSEGDEITVGDYDTYSCGLYFVPFDS